MDSDDLFWLRIWQTVGIVFCVMVVTIGGCVSNTHLAISRDLQRGTDPLAVACAHGNDGAGSACLVLAATKH